MSPVAPPTESLWPDLAPDAYRTGALVSFLRLQWFIRLRWGLALVAFAALALERVLAPGTPRPWQLFFVVALVAIANLFWSLTSRLLHQQLSSANDESAAAQRTAARFANAQVALDLLLLTLILRYTGGVESPLALFYVFHVAIAALLLRRVQALAQTLWAVLLFATMAVGEITGVITPHYEFLPGLPSPGWYADPAFVSVMIVVQSAGVLGLAYFTLAIAARLDQRDRQLLAANEALRRSKLAIEDLQQRRSRFMQTAAHQLKSPLAVIQTLAGLIRDGVVPEAGIPGTTDKIINRCQEGISQVSELLKLARVQEANPRRHRQVLTEVGDVTMRLCRQLKPAADDKQLAFAWHIPRRCDLAAHIDPRDAADCIGNLIENAIKYTNPHGTVSVKVTCVTGDAFQHSPKIRVPDNEDGYIYVCVRDNGIGIDTTLLGTQPEAEDQGSIFDAFRRGNNALELGIPGTGLGLSIVREVIEQAGGRIHVWSRPGEGSAFTLAIPGRRTPISAVRDTRTSEIIVEPEEPAAAQPAAPHTSETSSDSQRAF